jgi:hypothetical protein
MTRSIALLLFAPLALVACGESSAPRGTPGGGDCAPLRNVDDVIRVYGSAWNEPDADKRLCALEQSMTEAATYVDPTIDTSNPRGLADAIGDFQTNAPKASIAQLSGLDARTGELRFAWDFSNGGTSAITGVDYMELAADGRITSIRGYWDPLPTEPPTGVLAAYVAAWKATDAASRQASLALAVTDDVRFTAPEAAGSGAQALSEAMQSAPGSEVTGTQTYPKFARIAFSAQVAGGGSEPATDYLHLGADGKIVRIARFVGALPPL